MLKITKTGVAAALIAALYGCGGGSGSASNSTPQAAIPALQGAFTGTNSANTIYNTLILEDGSFYSYYGSLSGNELFVNGLGVGKTTSSNGSWNVTYNDYQGGAMIATGTGSGTYTASTLSGSNSEAGQTYSFSLAAPAANIYTYKTPALVSLISGAWNGNATDGSANSWSINANGSFTGMSNTGCGYSGNFTPRPSGANVFNVTLTFGAAPCLLAGQSANGIAVTYLLTNGQTEMVVIGTHSSPDIGIGLFGVR